MSTPRYVLKEVWAVLHTWNAWMANDVDQTGVDEGALMDEHMVALGRLRSAILRADPIDSKRYMTDGEITAHLKAPPSPPPSL